jgi:beta-aspartyl-dipeptidase (metallo-type)
MLTLLKNIDCYSPKYLGKKDILMACDKIYKILDANSCEINKLINQVINCSDLKAFPGIIDQHVHIIGGGGEEGFSSRIPELDFNEIINAGVTTLVGVLGVDSYTRSLQNLLAKAHAIDEQGVTTYIYTGSYAVPTVTLTGNIINDIVLIDKIIGTGEIAISDHRSSQPNMHELSRLAAETHIGGLLSDKACDDGRRDSNHVRQSGELGSTCGGEFKRFLIEGRQPRIEDEVDAKWSGSGKSEPPDFLHFEDLQIT